MGFGEYIYGPSSQEAAATIGQLAKSFCREYKINQEALAAGKSGIVIGRYPGDHYAGGNPWQLLTAVLGETFYLGATATLKKMVSKIMSLIQKRTGNGSNYLTPTKIITLSVLKTLQWLKLLLEIQ